MFIISFCTSITTILTFLTNLRSVIKSCLTRARIVDRSKVLSVRIIRTSWAFLWISRTCLAGYITRLTFFVIFVNLNKSILARTGIQYWWIYSKLVVITRSTVNFICTSFTCRVALSTIVLIFNFIKSFFARTGSIILRKIVSVPRCIAFTTFLRFRTALTLITALGTGLLICDVKVTI